MKINSIIAREVLDSRGNPTIEVELNIDKGNVSAIVPSGASTGQYEALELRDKDDRFHGKGVLKAIENVNKIAKEIIGMNCTKQEEIDQKMIALDNTEYKTKLGANAILGISMAVCRAGALAKNIHLYKYIQEISGNKELKLPVPSLNVINGGQHAGNKLDIQEYMILPIGAPNFREAIRYGSETYHHLKKIIKEKYGQDAVNVGDEGGFAPPLTNIEEPIQLLEQAIEKAGYKGKIKIGLDCAASEFFKEDKYNIEEEKLTGDELIEKYKQIIEKHELISIEDPFDQDDWESYAKLTKTIGEKCQIVGDDLLVTNPKKIKKAIEEKSCNALLLKVNQIGTITEAIEACNLAKKAGWNIMISHRSGETEDTFIADLVVGLGTGQIKSGAPARGERTCKYNQLMRIEEIEKIPYAGSDFF